MDPITAVVVGTGVLVSAAIGYFSRRSAPQPTPPPPPTPPPVASVRQLSVELWGPTNAGKTTLLEAVYDYFSLKRRQKLLSVEDLKKSEALEAQGALTAYGASPARTHAQFDADTVVTDDVLKGLEYVTLKLGNAVLRLIATPGEALQKAGADIGSKLASRLSTGKADAIIMVINPFVADADLAQFGLLNVMCGIRRAAGSARMLDRCLTEAMLLLFHHDVGDSERSAATVPRTYWDQLKKYELRAEDDNKGQPTAFDSASHALLTLEKTDKLIEPVKEVARRESKLRESWVDVIRNVAEHVGKAGIDKTLVVLSHWDVVSLIDKRQHVELNRLRDQFASSGLVSGTVPVDGRVLTLTHISAKQRADGIKKSDSESEGAAKADSTGPSAAEKKGGVDGPEELRKRLEQQLFSYEREPRLDDFWMRLQMLLKLN